MAESEGQVLAGGRVSIAPRISADGLAVRVVIGVLGMMIIFLAVVYLFQLRMILEEFYLNILIALAIPIFFLLRRARPGKADFIPWYDILLAVTGGGIGIYFALNAQRIAQSGWEMGAPTPAVLAGFALLLILLEGTRRAFGWLMFGLCAFFLVEPLFSHLLPGPFAGLSFSFPRVISYHVFGYESMLGPVGATAGKLLIGYLLFTGVLQASGGGKLLLDLALSLFGRFRGAPAKVSVASSGVFGMFSGMAISNILTTGAFTIPAMKKSGYPAYYAASVEACSSTGGVIMPPVMGAVAFLMASILGVPYWEIALASFTPAIIYYTILFIQADSFAGRRGLKALSPEEIPSFWRTLALAFPYLVSMLVLIYFLAFEAQESRAPFYTILALLLCSLIRKETRPSLASLWRMLESSFALIAELFILIYMLGVLVGSLSLTGVATLLGYGLTDLVGGSSLLLPVVAMVAGYVLGIGMPATAIYILLSITLAPALTAAGYPLLVTHLFLVYVGLMSFIIPPVALSAITAGRLAGEPSAFKVGFTSMRLGIGLLLLPIVFVLDRSLLIGQAPLGQTAVTFLLVALGFVAMGFGFEGYAIRFRLRLWQSLALVVIGAAAILLSIWF